MLEAKEGNIFVTCNNINYIFKDVEIINNAKELALKEIEEEYIKINSTEKTQYEQALDSGAISSIKEYEEALGESVAKYIEPFNVQNFDIELTEKTSLLLRNYYDLPLKTVVEIPEVAKENHDVLKATLEKKFGFEVSSFNNYQASREDIVKSQSYDTVTKMIDSDDYKKFADLREGLNKHYSYKNAMLIYSQKSDAKIVMSLTDWNTKYDRKVKSGEKGLSIWCPTDAKEVKTEKGAISFLKGAKDKITGEYSYPYGLPNSNSYKQKFDEIMKDIKEKGKYTEVASNYVLRPVVFDISQTEMLDKTKTDNLMDIVNMNKPIKADLIGDRSKIAEAIENVASLSSGTIKFDEGKSEADVIYDTVKNYADTLFSTKPSLIDGIKSNNISNSAVHTIETAISAYLVANHLGIDANEKTNFSLAKLMDDIPLEKFTIGRRDVFEQGFKRAFTFSDWFNKNYDKEMEFSTVEFEQFNDKLMPVIDKWKGENGGKFKIGENSLDNGTKNYVAVFDEDVKRGAKTFHNHYEATYSEKPNKETVEKDLYQQKQDKINEAIAKKQAKKQQGYNDK